MTRQEKEQQDRRLQEMRKRHAGKTGLVQREKAVQQKKNIQQEKAEHQEETVWQEKAERQGETVWQEKAERREETVQRENAERQEEIMQMDSSKQVPQQEVIRIKYHSNEIKKLEYIDGKSDWVDLRSAENVKMKQGEFRLISLGISMQLPKGYEAVIVPRSSTYKNFGIIQTNHMGIIDESYCGDKDIWRMPVLATRDTQIQVNDRICQFRIQKHQPKLVFEETDSLGRPNRGGFGSTGKQ